MIATVFSWFVVAMILLGAGAMLINRDWRIQLGALALQYFATFWLVTRHQPFIMGSAKLVTGWMVVAAIGMTRLSLTQSEHENEPAPNFIPDNRWFSIALLAIMVLVTAGATPRIEEIIPGLGLPVIAGGLLLITTGMIHLGITSDILRVILSLLTILAGFDILYAAVESSILVAGLLALTNLGLGLVGSYLLVAGSASTHANFDEEQLL
ncbi:MAG: hypothetical protein U0Z26_13320 [Anaerolineales bacterium]